MEPRTEEVRQFIEVYDVIRTDKAGPLSRRDLDWTFLAERFDTIFELSMVGGQLTISQASPGLADALALRGGHSMLRDIFPQALSDEICALFDEMRSSANRGILAGFKTAPGLPLREYELVLLPAESEGVTSAIGTLGVVTGRPESGADLEAERELIASLRLQDEDCFDLRQRLLSRMGSMLVQCVVSPKLMLPGGPGGKPKS